MLHWSFGASPETDTSSRVVFRVPYLMLVGEYKAILNVILDL